MTMSSVVATAPVDFLDVLLRQKHLHQTTFHPNPFTQTHSPKSIAPETMTDTTQRRFGFVNFAETWNGRLAMLGFVIGLGTELLTGQGILNQLGF